MKAPLRCPAGIKQRFSRRLGRRHLIFDHREGSLMSHCLVTGGAGFIGSHLTEYLLARGHVVSVLDDLSTGREENLAAVAGHPRLQIRKGSITDPVLLAHAVRGTAGI